MMSSNAFSASTRAVRLLVAPLALALVVAGSGCGKKADPPPPAAPDCATAVQNALKLSMDDIKAALPTLDAQGVEKMKVASLARCQEDAWSPEARTCMAAAKTSSEVVKCEEKKTAEQREKLLKAIQEAATPAGDPGSAAEPTPGSAGSAASGSAAMGSGSAAGSAAPR